MSTEDYELHQTDHTAETPTERESEAATDRLRIALSSIRAETDYETATLFVPGDDGHWHLAERVGPVRPWHNILEPDLIDALTESAVYPNARSIPGVGLRLSGLGCGSVAVFPVPGGGRLVLDRAFPKPDGELVVLDSDHLALLSEGAAEAAEAAPASSAPDDIEIVTRVGEAIRRVFEIPGYTMRNALSAVRDLLGAEQIAVVGEESDGSAAVLGAADDQWSPEVTSTIRAILRILPSTDPIPPDHTQRLAAALGIASTYTGAGFCREDGEREVLVCGWEDRPLVTARSLIAVARILGAARLAFRIRSEELEAHLAPERARWAHDIHDGITQSVTAAVIALENLRNLITTDPSSAASLVGDSQTEIRRSLSELRATMADLSDDGVVTRHKPLDELVEDIVQRWRLPARISVEGDIHDLPETVLAVALVVIREALTNAAKHSGATNVTVRVMAHPEGLTVVVKDNGRGFTPGTIEHASRGAHLGTGLMRQRVAEVGGTIQISSAPGVGTKVVAFLPVSPPVGT